MPGKAFTDGFSSGFGRTGSRGYLQISTGFQTTYEDGDIVSAVNFRMVRYSAADGLCHHRRMGFNSNGLRPVGSLADLFQAKTYQYKFERISATEIRRTDLSTLAEVIIGPTPTEVDGQMQHMDVKAFIARRRKHPEHRLFGIPGAEYWYGGRQHADHDKLDLIWTDIESNSVHLEVDHQVPTFDYRKYLVVSVNDFDDDVAGTFIAPLLDDPQAANPVTLKKRKSFVSWRDLRDVVEGQVLTKNLPVRIDQVRKHVHQEILQTKTV